ncbi:MULTISPECIES: KAP family P-loop NTPase fold protein [Bacillaceae]|uniref:KAP family P-loop NTPase fold protein n=1 Tax=Bacillaceae TaxID=186817 RepID=UPI0005AA632D|nr:MULTISPECIES: P-loop NTPase fold protein [Bacillaceae]MEC1742278.1 P-loop NTPase fold protein [Schinkia azotoformans]MEC1767493.1 P-loop NTPase fold protein [Schinkia azotoformans]MEC1788585.1 P-loop NTPase fold protein [Schinkia azotoformans]MED4419816.1 P-loop NTPase fold protein [Schinkia azotoformans]
MWADDASKIDMLAYRPYADLITEIAISERMNPLTIGLFGNWGSGKSTLLNLIEEQTNIYTDKKIAVIKVNAWMFEGYEDAKTALMEAILQGMKENKTFFEGSKDGIKSLMERVNWMAVGKTALKQGIPLAISGITGLPPLIMMPNSSEFDTPEEVQKQIDKAQNFKQEYMKTNSKENVVENIRGFREGFSTLIEKSSVDNLIILIDDLDRCNPDRIIETLEAIKLFLSVPRTTFIIAMDESIISYSIKRKYPQLNDEGINVSDDYIEKIVQLPIKIAELAESDVKNYMLLLIAEMFLEEESLNQLIEKLKTKGIFIKGEIISGTEILDIVQKDITVNGLKYKGGTTQEEFEQQIQIFNSIGSIVASSLKGNPRQTKRFLNTFYIRKRLAEIQQIEFNLAILAKLMVLEYFDSDRDLFKELFQWQFEHSGKPIQLSTLEKRILDESEDGEPINIEDISKNPAWTSDKMKRWFGTEPRLADVDLSPYFYLARDSVAEKRLFSTNLNQEERKYINQICNLETHIALRRKKIEQMLEMDEVTRNEIFKGVLEKYHQDNTQLETLIEFYKLLPQYKSKVFEEFKKLKVKDITLTEILLFQQLDDESFQILKKYYVEEKKADIKLWDLAGV